MTDPNLNQPPANQPPTSPAQGYAPPPAAQPYGQQPGQAQPHAQPYATTPATNMLAIVALIGAFLIPPAGIICGHIALGQIKKTGEGGHGLALWGTILGYVFTVLWVLVIAVSFILPLILFGSMATEFNSL